MSTERSVKVEIHADTRWFDGAMERMKRSIAGVAEGGRIEAPEGGYGDSVPAVLTEGHVFIGRAGELPTKANLERMREIGTIDGFAPRIVLGFDGSRDDEVFAHRLWLNAWPMTFDWIPLHRDHHHRETPARSAMHSTYRAKSNRRGKR